VTPHGEPGSPTSGHTSRGGARASRRSRSASGPGRSGKLIPALATGATWPYTAIGIGFAIVGVFCSGYAFWRYREVEEAVSRREFVSPDERLVALLSGIGAALGVLLVVVLLTES
jgi:hypothetical protein